MNGKQFDVIYVYKWIEVAKILYYYHHHNQFLPIYYDS